MRIKRKMLSLMLALAMIAGLLAGGKEMTAMAAGTSSIIIDSGGETGIDMTRREFNLYKIFDATAVANAGVEYNWVTQGETKLFHEFFFGSTYLNLQAPANGQDIDAVVRYINTLDTAVEIHNFGEALLAYANAKNIAPVTVDPSNVTKTYASIAYQNLEMGYYLVEDVTEDPDVIASLMLTTSSATAIHLKATKPTIDKFVYKVNGVEVAGSEGVKGASVSVGDQVTYRISILIPDISTYLNGYFFHFRDLMGGNAEEATQALELDRSTIEVRVNGTVIDDLTAGENNRANYVALPYNFEEFKAILTTAAAGGDTAEVQKATQAANLILATLYGPNTTTTAANLLENPNLRAIYDTGFSGGGILFDLYEPDVFSAGGELEVFYTATINENIIESTVTTGSGATQEHTVVNTAKLAYTRDPGNPANLGSAESKAYISTHHFTVTKVAATSDGTTTATILPGATFMLYQQVGEDAEGNPVYASTAMEFVKTTNADGSFSYHVPSEAEITAGGLTDQLENNPADVTGTDATPGYLELCGLGTGNYMLVEVDAPDGYILPEKPFCFNIGSAYGPAGYLTGLNFYAETENTPEKMEGVAVDLAHNRIRSVVTNIPSVALPDTGGMGTALFTLAGVVLMGGAAVYMVMSRKRRVDEK